MRFLKNIKSKFYKIISYKTVSTLVFVGPYYLLFFTFIVLAVLAAILLSFTDFNSIEFPNFIGLKNYVNLFTQDDIFMQKVLPNTIKFVLIVVPGGYILSFLLAWMLAQLPHKIRTILAVILYSPSMTMGVAMAVVWKSFFSGDPNGYLNSILLKFGMITEPIQWLQSPEYLMTIMIIVTLWSSMGVGFLAMLSGMLNIDQQLYEAAYIDGMKNKFQEIFYITIPLMKPQMLFGAVMAVVNTFQSGGIGVALSGTNPTPQYSGQLIVNHIEDYGFIRFEMGFAAAISVILLIIVNMIAKGSSRVLGNRD